LEIGIDFSELDILASVGHTPFIVAKPFDDVEVRYVLARLQIAPE
jgi:hypothetical protein